MMWEEVISLQIQNHSRVNLLAARQRTAFQFTNETKQLMQAIASGKLTVEEENKILDYTTRAVLSSLYRINQYYYFNTEATAGLLAIYRQLLNDIKNAPSAAIDYDGLAETHYQNLQQWLLHHHPE